MTDHTTPDAVCPNCSHPHHLPGTECATPVNHGPNRWHLCLCLARPGAALSCPPQMTCQGGTLGYADVWYLQHGHTLLGEDGEIAPGVFVSGVASVGFPSGPDIAAASSAVRPPATDRTALRERIAEAVRKQAETGNVRYEAIADAVLAVLPAVDRAAVLREAEEALRARAKRLTGEFNDSDILHEDGPAAAVATWKRAADLLRRMGAEPASVVSGRAAEQQAAADYARALATPPSAETLAYIRDRVSGRAADEAQQGGLTPVGGAKGNPFDYHPEDDDAPAIGGAQQPKETRP